MTDDSPLQLDHRTEHSSNVIEQLVHLDEGDQIAVSARETPMEVDAITVLRNDSVVLKASNYHGRYTLRQHVDGTVSFRAGGKLVSGDVEVTLSDE